MDIQNNSLVDTIIDYANVKFGIEMTAEQAQQQFSELSFSNTLKLVEIIKAEDDEGFSELIDLSLEEAGYGVAGTTRDSAATQRKTDTTFNQASLQQKRDTTLNNKNMRAGNRPERNVAGANKTSTGSRTSTDPDDQQRSSNSQQSAQNSAEINRLKQLLSRR